MNSFHSNIIDGITANSNGKWEDCLFLFPNRRACKYFRKELAATLKNPVFAPSIISIEDFITSQYKGEVLDKIPLNFKLFPIYQKIRGWETGFDAYFPWGNMLIQDFNTIDKYTLDPKKIFKEIKDLKDLDRFLTDGIENEEALTGFWTAVLNEKNLDQERFLGLWNQLLPIYTEFKKSLTAENLAYTGMAYRHLAENMDWLEDFPYSEVYFCGFHALSVSEKKIIRQIEKTATVNHFWDLDSYYLDDSYHEAGHFFREQFKYSFKRPDKQWIGNLLRTGSKQINIISVPTDSGQAAVAADILHKISINSEYNAAKTVVILNNELLLTPLLEHITPETGDLNLTMGLGIQQSHLPALVENLFKLKINSKPNKSGFIFLLKDIISLAYNPLLNYALPEDWQTIQEKFSNSGRITVTGESILELTGSGFIKQLFDLPEKAIDWPEYLIEVLNACKKLISSQSNNKLISEMGFITEFTHLLENPAQLLKESGIQADFTLLGKICERILSGITLPFEGNSLDRIQVMGLLESRTLDFENVIFVSLNEGNIPAGRNYNSFLPYNIRKAFGLPVYDDQDSISAYYFYRLLQRAKNIHFIYNTTPDALSGGEPSRFIIQVRKEWIPSNPGLTVRERILMPKTGLNIDSPVQIDKTGTALDMLISKYTNGNEAYLSPSALSYYITCPLKFYYSKVLGLREHKVPGSPPDAGITGSVFHDIMQNVYEGKTGKTLKEDDLKSSLNSIKETVDHIFKQKIGSASGKNFLIREFLNRSVVKVLETDLDTVKKGNLRIEELETGKYSMQVSINANGQAIKVNLGGVIDRIDRVDGQLRIIDYKTGKEDIKISSLDNIEDLFTNPDKKAAFQTLTYSLIYLNNHPETGLQTGLFLIRSGKENLQFILNGKEINRLSLENFNIRLTALIQEIFNDEIPFDQTDDLKRCSYCIYRDICNRN